MYIGQQPVVGRYILLDQISGGFNGTTSGFTMSTAGGVQGVKPGLAQNVLLSLGGVIQQPGVDYTISGSGITFTTPPVSGTTFFATVLGDAQSVGTPSDGTVTPASIASGFDFGFPNVNVTGVITIASGVAATPSLSITGDTDTGLFSPAADTLGFATAGVQRLSIETGEVVVNDGSSDVDFRVESNDNTHMLFVDGGNDRVGIGTSSPNQTLKVVKASSGGTVIEFSDNVNATGRLGTPSSQVVAFGGNTNHSIAFGGYSTDGSTFSAERMRIDTSGRVGIGTSSPDDILDVRSGAAGFSQFVHLSGQGGVRIAGTGASSSANLVFSNNHNLGVTDEYTIQMSGDNDRLTFRSGGTGDTERVSFMADGKVGIGTSSPQRALVVSDAGDEGFEFFPGSSDTGNTLNHYDRGSSSFIDITTNADQHIFSRADGEKVRIDSQGRLLVGTSSDVTGSTSHLIQAVNTIGGRITLARNDTSVTAGQTIGQLAFSGNDSNGSYQQVASITCEADGTHGDDDKPGRLRFMVTADGAGSASEAMRIDSSADVLIGATSGSGNRLYVVDNFSDSFSDPGDAVIRVENANTSGTTTQASISFTAKTSGSNADCAVVARAEDASGNASLQFWTDTSNGMSEKMRLRSNTDLILGPYRAPNTFGTVSKNVPYEIKVAPYGWSNGSEIASISMGAHGGTGQDDGEIVFKTAQNVHSSSTGLVERARIDDSGRFYVGKTSTSFTTEGACISQFDGNTNFATAGAKAAAFIRNTNDGTVISIRQDGTEEGTISVSGSSVSYNGGHLARWSQLPSGAERTEILRGSVLSNLDEMCEWAHAAEEAVPAQEAVLYTEEDELPEGASVGDIKTPSVEGSPAVEAYTEDNEQLNRMKVSDVEGDVNVAGVFQAWDDDDDTYTNDFYCAMTGDFVIRIAQGTTVARGDLLMSAGDGTAKPQDDDIVRSKTIAKVTSTTVSTTYSDGSYCVPCVLMAC